MEDNRRKIIACFELTLMIASLFAFSYMTYATSGLFEELDDVFEEARAEKMEKIAEMDVPERPTKKPWYMKVIGAFRKPMVPSVSAQSLTEETIIGYDPLGNPIILTDETIVSTREFSGSGSDLGCCFLAVTGEKCAATAASACAAGSPFAEGSVCPTTSFCQKGCCFDRDSGTFDKNVLEEDCPREWNSDPNCNMPAARLGCCILGTQTVFETRGQCQTDTLARALGDDDIVDWREVNEAECIALAEIQREGACVLSGGNCKFSTETDCLNYEGQFNPNALCTSEDLDTSCEITDQTTCVDGKDGVYFVDSCGNTANIYDSSKATDQTYWNTLLADEDICGAENIDTGNAKSKSCGNCNRFAGGICGSATKDNFGVDMGNFYCKDTGCMFDGKKYKNGESWCVYDGKIGDSDDVVGSRHWKYVCSQGTVQVEPCADYRNQICAQRNTHEVGGTEVQFKNAACIANNWRECIDLNTFEDGASRCAGTLNCRLHTVDIADHFKFDVCLPKYPGGFSFSDERYMRTAEDICAMADQTCTVVYREKTFGDCEVVANEACLEEGFAQGMNDFCRGLGDCGGEVNIEGKFTANYHVEESPMLGEGAVGALIALARPVPGQFAEMEDYREYLEAAGLLNTPPPVPDAGDPEEFEILGLDSMQLGLGAIGVGYAVALASGATIAIGSYSIAASTPILPAAMGPFAGAAIGAGIGFLAGAYLAKTLGLSPGGSLLMSVGGAMVGAVIGYNVLAGNAALALCATGVGCIIAIIGLILIAISFFFGGDDCDPVEVKFECKPWKPPAGGGDCEKCNGDPLKPCSEYRCSSLGAACKLANKGSENEMCHSGADDGRPPILNPQLDVISGTERYDNIQNDGFSITNLNGGCVDAYTPLTFGISTDELAYCRFDMSMKEFGEMDYDLGPHAYVYNHTTTFTLPDPSHGQSQGVDWNGDLNFYVLCEDAFGHITPTFHVIDMCVNEGPDRTGPLIRAFEPINDGIVGFNTTEVDFTVVTNELSTCKWDTIDVDYADMTNEMTCSDSLGIQSHIQGYVCTDNMPTPNPENLVYIRCMDQPWLEGEGNANVESTSYLLRKPEKKIEIDWIEPSEDFETNTVFTTIELQIQTSGGGDFHNCHYSFSGYETMIKLFETGNQRLHIQPLNRPSGRDKIYVHCEDETGDFAQATTEYQIVYDTSTPQIARVWQQGSTLHLITTEEAECVYSDERCNFKWEDGTATGGSEEHTISVIPGKRYHIKCRDEFGNEPSGCSMTVNAV